MSQRVADAAKEIKTLIGDSVERVETGSAHVRRAGTAMQDIVAAVRRVGAINAEISSASLAQDEAIASVCQAVALVDDMTQQNAALVEESAAAAESLKGQAQSLTRLVRFFDVGDPSPTEA